MFTWALPILLSISMDISVKKNLCRQGKFRIFELKQDKIFFERKFKEKTSLMIQKVNNELKIKSQCEKKGFLDFIKLRNNP